MRKLIVHIVFVSFLLAGCSGLQPVTQESTDGQVLAETLSLPDTPLPPTAKATLTPKPSDTPQPSATPAPTETPKATATRWRPSYPKGRCEPGDGRTCQILFVMPFSHYATHAETMPSQFRGAGYTVVIASHGSEDLIDCDSAQNPEFATKLSVDLWMSEVQVSDYDAIIYVGGFGCREQWMDMDAFRIAQEAVEQGIVLGAAGCAPTILAKAGVLEGRISAMYSGQPPVKQGEDYCQVIEDMGGICSDQEIVRDGLILTAWPRSSFFVPGILQLIVENNLPPVSSWMQIYQTEPRSAAMDMARTPDGGYILVGSTNHSHQNRDNEDLHLLKVEDNGEIAWQKIYGGDRYDRARAVLVTGDGGYLVLGETKSFGAGGLDMYLLKIDSQGELLWEQTYGGPGDEKAAAISPGGDGYALSGSSGSFGDGSMDVYLLRINAGGDELWSQTFGGDLVEEGHAVFDDPDGSFFILAERMLPGDFYMDQDSDIYLIKTDLSGQETWSQVLAEDGVQGGYSMAPAGEDLVVGGFLSLNGSDAGVDPLVRKLDVHGDLIWEAQVGEQDCFDYASNILATADGGFILTGMYSCAGDYRIPLIKVDAAGNLLWRQYLYTGLTPRVGLKVLQAEDGGYVILGQVAKYSRGDFESILIKTDSQGNLSSEN